MSSRSVRVVVQVEIGGDITRVERHVSDPGLGSWVETPKAFVKKAVEDIVEDVLASWKFEGEQ